MADFFFNALLGAAAAVEAPVDGQTGVWIKQGATVISSAMKMQGAVVSSGAAMYVYNRGSAVSGSIVGSALVSRGGILSSSWVHNSATISSGGTALHVSVGGGISGAANPRLTTAQGAVVEYLRLSSAPGAPRGTAWIQQTTASNVIVDGGYALVRSSAIVSGLTLASSGAAGIQATASATDIVQNAGAGNVIVEAGASATLVTVRAAFYVRGWASALTVESGGRLFVSSGGTALAVTSSAGATVTVYDGGHIEYA